MDIEKDIKSISYLKANVADMLTYVNTTHHPVVITQNGEARAVLQDPETYQETRRTLGLLKLLVQSETDIKNGDLVAHDDVVRTLKKRLAGD